MITLNNIELSYGGSLVIRSFSEAFESGRQYGLYGRSGSGKTSLLNIISGIVKPSSGEMLVDGNSTKDHSEKDFDQYRKNYIGYVFQNFHLIRSLTVIENLLLAQKISRGFINDVEALKLLKELGLQDKANSYSYQLSTGQIQRAAIARAIINKPKILLADEPTSSLDDENSENIISLLLSLSEESGSTLIVATHDTRIKNRFSKIIELTNE